MDTDSIQEEPKYEFSGFLVELGGALSLFLGSSLVYSTMEDTFEIIRQGRINFEDLYIAWDLLEYE